MPSVRSTLVPNANIIRFLLTAASRVPAINYAASNDSDYVSQMESEKEIPRNYTNLTPLNTKAALLLQVYIGLLNTSISDSEREDIYHEFNFVFSEFIVAPLHQRPFQERNASKQAKKDISNLYSVTSLPTNSPKSRNRQQKEDSADATMYSPSAHSVVEDSEDGFSPISRPRVLEEEIDVFEKFAPTKPTSQNKRSLLDSIGLLSHIAAPSSPRSSRNSPEIPSRVRMFDEELITAKLNPNTNNHYSLWNLVEWMFYCASSASDPQDDLTGIDYHRQLYYNYSTFFTLVLDFVEFDYWRFVEKKVCSIIDCDVKEFMQVVPSLSASEVKLCTKAFHSFDFLLAKLFQQKTPKLIYWFDRGLEAVFSGLDGASRVQQPIPCYEKELELAKKLNKNKSDLINSCVLDSFKIRHKFVYTMYSMSLIYSYIESGNNQPKKLVDEESPLGLSNFTTQLSKKLNSLDPSAVEEFLKASLVHIDDTNYDKESFLFIVLMLRGLLHQTTKGEFSQDLAHIFRVFVNYPEEEFSRHLVAVFDNSSIFRRFMETELSVDSLGPLIQSWNIFQVTCCAISQLLQIWNYRQTVFTVEASFLSKYEVNLTKINSRFSSFLAQTSDWTPEYRTKAVKLKDQLRIVDFTSSWKNSTLRY
ncbi:hypothetical protein PSN45_000263 [Yamadazyma tenuis]|uniref:Uncharacterized protein n=1 Tax=Candida tenuis (strain ATCC 10573 / BCRC 21748 / CBS 615 / JCM 9827 / NBRC 10315 / NRRL Y-1498 / VKM Y-70) TaxID=590646 RepID=G3B775_CANTC|nr:uncharacterized protein CANTEDRAFT_94473 [Yamadazyma tenuis ATCC 10573]EGV61583.1 hypothetical protein CANTEDRAFT_94473 [Yamadazyma tenuis ATCC 10573]WEJ92807.1 hypothetical protein PSN45_000263 [Yamadazyma tenuis]